MKMVMILTRFIHFLFGLIAGLLGIRIILKLFGANTAAPFVNWIYAVTAPLLTPFKGIFPAPELEGGFVIEFTALFAMLIYALVAYGLLELVVRTDNLSLQERNRSTKHKLSK